MSGLGILGGIGAGLMQGSQFVRQARLDNENKQYRGQAMQQNQARLDMLQQDQERQNQQFEWQKQDRAAREAEAQRAAKFDALRQSTYQRLSAEQGDAFDPVAADVQVFKDAVGQGIVPKDELDPLLKQVATLRQRGLTAALRAGDTNVLGQALSQSFGQPVSVQVGQGKSGAVYSVLGKDGRVLSQLNQENVASIIGADDILAEREREAKLAELRAKAGEHDASAAASRAQAGKYGAETAKANAEAYGQRLENEGLAALSPVQRPGAKKGGGADLTADAKNAKYLVQIGRAKNEQEAWDLIRKDASVSQTLDVAARLMQSPKWMTNAEGAYAEAERLVKAARQGKQPDAAPASASRPPLSSFQK